MRYPRPPPPAEYLTALYNELPPYNPPPPRQNAYPSSFVPGFAGNEAKRRRRRPEEIERIYQCGWDGCEKGYGTLNHLNAHVTMQGHGEKRKPEEFKEIRKQWKERKKEVDRQRRQMDDDAQKSEASNGR
ncbi:hypothetical protein PG985_009786 [Apiospora marii]|uniref:C2H2-type domain-containing protein n=1 Tax=Apiospora marii TaxID=335849 RepID=A0ABR1RRE9_9PEZI